MNHLKHSTSWLQFRIGGKTSDLAGFVVDPALKVLLQAGLTCERRRLLCFVLFAILRLWRRTDLALKLICMRSQHPGEYRLWF